MSAVIKTRIDANGVPQGTYTGDFETVARNCEGWVSVAGAPNGDWWNIVTGQWETKPTQPTSAHIFDYTTKQWYDPRTSDSEWVRVRDRRNLMLTQSDWTQLPDVPSATKEAWTTYRQSLRDITEQSDPFSIVWPTPPVT